VLGHPDHSFHHPLGDEVIKVWTGSIGRSLFGGANVDVLADYPDWQVMRKLARTFAHSLCTTE
jgi:hypothetical protein